MGKKCKVPHCNSHGAKISVFGVPKSEIERKKWSDILGCSLNANSYVCERHFDQSDIKNSFTHTRTDNGVLLCNYALKRKDLVKGALPKIESNMPCEDGLSSEVDLKTEYEIEDMIKGALPKRESNMPCEDGLSSEVDIKTEYEIVEQDCEGTSKNTLVDQVEADLPENDEDILLTPKYELSDDAYLNLRTKILYEECNIALPNPKWGIHKCLQSKSIMFSYMEMRPSSDDCNRLIPTCIKRIAFGNTIEVFFLHKDVKLTSISEPTTIDELQHILFKVDSYTICSGGPSTNFYHSARPECAIRDNSIWRHKDCPVILDKGSICKYCVNLHKLLSQYVDRQNKANKRVRLSASPSQGKSQVRTLPSTIQKVDLIRKQIHIRLISEAEVNGKTK